MSAAWLAALAFGPPAGGFVFEDIAPWKWSEGRQENIPALSATLDNRTGRDWEEARFRVKVACEAGGERAYELRLRDVLVGKQKIAVTAFDMIGRVDHCEGRANVELLDAKEYEEERRPAYVVLGFAIDYGEAGVSTELEGILDHRRDDNRAETHRHYWRDGGWRIAVLSTPETGFYGFRVEPGDLGLAGFLVDREPGSTGPVDRFLRFFQAPAGKIAYLGVFLISKGPGLLRSVVLDPGEEYLPAIRAASPREVVIVRGSKPKVQGILTVEK